MRDPIPPTKAWTHFARNTYSNDDHVFKRWSRTNHPKRGKNPYTAPLREFHRRCSRRDDIHVRGGPVRARDERFQYFSHLCWRKRWKMWSVLGYRSLSKCVITWSYSSDSDSITCKSPRSYRQPSGKGQSLSRRYCTHSVWLFLCAWYTLQSFHGALAVSRKYFKQSKWPFMAARVHAKL
jgi:hypothetical protein